MNRALTICLTCLGALAELTPTPARATDIDALVNQLTQSLTIQRQRLRAQREDAEETRRAQLPDLSQFGTPVTEAPRRTMRHRSIDCTTIDMGEGISATNCD
jgi:hypothetical protein